MNEKMIEKLTAKGFNRWTKGKYDRLYINAKDLGLECEYYKTGNIAGATFQGEDISNSEAYRMKAAKTYIDIETGEAVSNNRWLKEAAEEILEAVKAEIEAEEAAEKKAEEAEENTETEEAEMIVRAREDEDSKGCFSGLNAKDIKTGKAEAAVVGKFFPEGFHDLTIFQKTQYSIKAVNAIVELFEIVARMDGNGNWKPAKGTTIARTKFDDGKKAPLYEVENDPEHFAEIAKKYA